MSAHLLVLRYAQTSRVVAPVIIPRVFIDHGTAHGLCFEGIGLLLPDPAVDAFAQQVGVPAVAGVLLDPVNPQLPHGDALPAHPLA